MTYSDSRPAAEVGGAKEEVAAVPSDSKESRALVTIARVVAGATGPLNCH